jgi:hypothetical protein
MMITLSWDSHECVERGFVVLTMHHACPVDFLVLPLGTSLPACSTAERPSHSFSSSAIGTSTCHSPQQSGSIPRAINPSSSCLRHSIAVAGVVLYLVSTAATRRLIGTIQSSGISGALMVVSTLVQCGADVSRRLIVVADRTFVLKARVNPQGIPRPFVSYVRTLGQR